MEKDLLIYFIRIAMIGYITPYKGLHTWSMILIVQYHFEAKF